MALSEAEELLSFILVDHAPGRVHLHRLGNDREWVLIVRNFFIWSVDDWLWYRQREEDSARARALRSTRQNDDETTDVL